MTQELSNRRFAVWALIAIFAAAILFHLLVLSGVVPFEIVWGGRLESAEEMPAFEAVSIALNSLFLLVSLIEGRVLGIQLSPKRSRAVFLVMGLIFTLNTVGNLLSLNAFEQAVFTGLTALIAALCFYLAFSRRG